MKMLAFKIIFFVVGVVFQGMIISWIISNDTFPIWADLIMLGGILWIWIMITEQFYRDISRKLRNINEHIE